MAKHIGDKHIVLVGMMGTGKTAVGQALARHLGRPFIDTDRMVEAREGRSVAELFQERGETYFRDTECAAIREATDASPSVIATGGGALLRQDNRDRLTRRGVLVWLQSDIDEIIRRTAKRQAARPLMNVENPKENLQRLLAEREPFYAEAPCVVNTTGKSVKEVASVIARWVEGHQTVQQEEE